jgi:hypothetical protein
MVASPTNEENASAASVPCPTVYSLVTGAA